MFNSMSMSVELRLRFEVKTGLSCHVYPTRSMNASSPTFLEKSGIAKVLVVLRQLQGMGLRGLLQQHQIP